MSQPTSIQFIINPISGTIQKKNLPELFARVIDSERYAWEIKHTNARGHATELARAAVEAGVAIVVAVGGDGTINEVAQALVHSQTALGIIPLGSGNGLARHLELPLDTEKALRVILEGKTEPIDSCEVNGKPFFCTSGVGFDAAVSHYFDTIEGRGLHNYVRSTFAKYFSYEPETYQIEVDGKQIERCAFIVSVANAGQYGNNAYISPTASLSDGLMDLVVMRKFPKPVGAWLIFLSFAKQIDKSSYLEVFKGKHFRITQKTNIAHIDGDPILLDKELEYKILEDSLLVRVRKG